MNSEAQNIATVIVWYNPTSEQIENTSKLAHTLKPIYVIDNSDVSTPLSFQVGYGFEYYWMMGNVGIAAALNFGCEVAKKRGSNFVLLLDQDSMFELSMLKKHLCSAGSLFLSESVAIVATSAQFPVPMQTTKCISVQSVITSGSIICLSAWHNVGGFNDSLFIDQVDHDFCIRIRQAGFKIIANLAIKMFHQVGDPVEKIVFGFHILSNNHHWRRRYYQVRNSLYLRRWYPWEAKPFTLYFKELTYSVLAIILLEKNRPQKLYAMFIGFIDFLRNRLGPWREI